MKISEKLPPALIKVGLESQDKEELFEEMVQLFVEAGLINDREAAIAALEEREAKMSTGVAKWLGLPHGKLEEAKEVMLALGVSSAGIEYDSLDGEPVYVVVMVFAEIGNPGPHIEALAEISRLFMIPGFIERIRNAQSAEEVLELIAAEEE
ncbi:MAG: PTS sugar transporter subunit IIA [Kiritimatiellaeota bacterium]|nr:PTS sugar transporter subunit IIA [Kiritimatiellota bacterium]